MRPKIRRGTARNIWRNSRKRREVRLPLLDHNRSKTLEKGEFNLRVAKWSKGCHFNGRDLPFYFAHWASDLLGLIHSDACGPLNTMARGGFEYFITFTDDFGR